MLALGGSRSTWLVLCDSAIVTVTPKVDKLCEYRTEPMKMQWRVWSEYLAVRLGNVAELQFVRTVRCQK